MFRKRLFFGAALLAGTSLEALANVDIASRRGAAVTTTSRIANRKGRTAPPRRRP
jgi:hypothetical protein